MLLWHISRFGHAILVLCCLSSLSLAARFVVIDSVNFSPFRIDLLFHDIPTRMTCVVLCHVTAMCVGGRFRRDQCGLTVDKFGRMGYGKIAQEPDDFVFGLFCDPMLGYTPASRGYIAYENHKVYSGIISLAKCQEKCSLYWWCLTADFDFDISKCYLAGLDKNYAKFIPVSTEDVFYSSKRCYV